MVRWAPSLTTSWIQGCFCSFLFCICFHTSKKYFSCMYLVIVSRWFFKSIIMVSTWLSMLNMERPCSISQSLMFHVRGQHSTSFKKFVTFLSYEAWSIHVLLQRSIAHKKFMNKAIMLSFSRIESFFNMVATKSNIVVAWT